MDLDKGASVFSQEVVTSSLAKVTVYSKTGCNDCNKVKLYLDDLVENNQLNCNDISVINCDSQLANNREQFVSDMIQMTGLSTVVFPLVFVNDRFIGGFKATMSTLSTFNKVEQNTSFNIDAAF